MNCSRCGRYQDTVIGRGKPSPIISQLTAGGESKPSYKKTSSLTFSPQILPNIISQHQLPLAEWAALPDSAYKLAKTSLLLVHRREIWLCIASRCALHSSWSNSPIPHARTHYTFQNLILQVLHSQPGTTFVLQVRWIDRRMI